MKFISLFLSALSFVVTSHAFGVGQQSDRAASSSHMNRSNFLALVGGAVTASACSPALAKEADRKKMDPDVESCLSQCMYECTKPKGVEQKSRKECLPECKQTCKKQLPQVDPNSS
jgi:hypothetical protein